VRITRRFSIAALSITGAIVLGLILPGCVGQGLRSVTSDDPAVKIPLIRKAVDSNDRSILPQLVRDLHSEDPAVRFYAIDGLRRLTGESFGYQWRDDEQARKPAVERWQQYIKSVASTLPAYRVGR